MNIEVGDLVKDRHNGDVGVVCKWAITRENIWISVQFATGRRNMFADTAESLTEYLEVINESR